MKQFLLYTAKILGAALIVTSAFIWAFEHFFLAKTTTHSSYKLGRFYEFEDDVLVLGSSRAEGSFLMDTMFPGEKAYNYGIIGTGNWLWQNQLHDLRSNGKSELIIINVDPDSLSSGTAFDPNVYLNVPKSSHVYHHFDPELRRQVSTFPFKYFGRIIDLTRSGLKEWMSPTAYSHLGTLIHTKEVSDLIFFSRPITKEGTLFCDTWQMNQLRTALTGSEDRILFVKLPAYGEQNDRHFFGELEPRLADLDNVAFVDLSGTLQDKAFWIDHAHVNFEGARSVAQMISIKLDELRW